MLLPISYRQKQGDDWWKPADTTGQQEQESEWGLLGIEQVALVSLFSGVAPWEVCQLGGSNTSSAAERDAAV